jgi:hypothetical protein
MPKTQSRISIGCEDNPMTLQIAIRTKEGFVLASDTNTLVDPEGSAGNASYATDEPKTCVNAKHQIGIAVAGFSPPEVCPLVDLDRFFSSLPSMDDFEAKLRKWINEYTKRHACTGSFLLVLPRREYERLLKISFVKDASLDPVPDCQLHPNPGFSANFWPLYFRCDQRPKTKAAKRIAAITIFMGGQITNNYGIRNLEMWQYTGKWRKVTKAEVDKLKEWCFELDKQLHNAIVA